MKTLYFDCFSGISGDMTIGALLDLGLDLEYLKAELKKLAVEGYELRASRVVRANLSAMKFDVLMEGDENEQHHHEHNHPHEHPHGHHHPRPGHFHRRASEILAMIRESSLNPNTKRIATDIFTKLAISEGKVHHIPPEDVEFHEVGAVDSIVDTVGSAIGFDALGIERFRCSAINIGSGFIHCQHGIFPVPAPATADLLLHATIYSKYANTELVTPTGAAILAAVVDRFEPLQGFATDRIGYGAGTKQFADFPNCLRLMLGEDRAVAPEPGGDTVIVIEANIDDMNPQNFGYVTEKLLEAGALDRRVVDEQVLARVIGRDESKALVVAEPLHSSCSHLYSLRVCALRNAEGAKRNNCRDAGTAFRSDGSPTRVTSLAALEPDGQLATERCAGDHAVMPGNTRFRSAVRLGGEWR